MRALARARRLRRPRAGLSRSVLLDARAPLTRPAARARDGRVRPRDSTSFVRARRLDRFHASRHTDLLRLGYTEPSDAQAELGEGGLERVVMLVATIVGVVCGLVSQRLCGGCVEKYCRRVTHGEFVVSCECKIVARALSSDAVVAGSIS